MKLEEMILGETLTCRNCLFWADGGNLSGTVATYTNDAPGHEKLLRVDRYDQDLGLCRKLPPSREGWPCTRAEDWCGEYKCDRETSKKFEAIQTRAFKENMEKLGHQVREIVMTAEAPEEVEN